MKLNFGAAGLKPDKQQHHVGSYSFHSDFWKKGEKVGRKRRNENTAKKKLRSKNVLAALCFLFLDNHHLRKENISHSQREREQYGICILILFDSCVRRATQKPPNQANLRAYFEIYFEFRLSLDLCG